MNNNRFLTLISLISLLMVVTNVYPQTFSIGHEQTSYYDANRDRDIACDVYYPADADGDNTAVSDGSFPVLVFGHGFVIGTSAYEYIWTSMVPQGFVVVMPDTETSMSPSHQDFADDIRFLADYFKTESANNSNFNFYQKITHSVLMGHSMGGGSSCLAAVNNNSADLLINFALNDTDPSAIDQADQISIPALIFSGSHDCISAPEENQIPLFCGLGSNDKTFISITGASHCQFADFSTTCSMGELTCSPSASISREEQQQTCIDYLSLFLDWKLNNNPDAETAFIDSLNTSTRITSDAGCTTTGFNSEKKTEKIKLYPNPSNENIFIENFSQKNGLYCIYNSLGSKLLEGEIYANNTINVDIEKLEKGIYLLQVIFSDKKVTKMLIVS
ncbi:MAG: hypothetical protein C0594_04015 [Marinilabiliales bacterium]|nr:MAG: hypothetical protein C0594_04015 [Marinilabiliales bacterium]